MTTILLMKHRKLSSLFSIFVLRADFLSYYIYHPKILLIHQWLRIGKVCSTFIKRIMYHLHPFRYLLIPWRPRSRSHSNSKKLFILNHSRLTLQTRSNHPNQIQNVENNSGHQNKTSTSKNSMGKWEINGVRFRSCLNTSNSLDTKDVERC